jgi:hypothetical protein
MTIKEVNDQNHALSILSAQARARTAEMIKSRCRLKGGTWKEGPSFEFLMDFI